MRFKQRSRCAITFSTVCFHPITRFNQSRMISHLGGSRCTQSRPQQSFDCITDRTHSLHWVMQSHVTDTPAWCIVDLGNSIQCEYRDCFASRRGTDLVICKVQSIVNFIGDHHAIGPLFLQLKSIDRFRESATFSVGLLKLMMTSKRTDSSIFDSMSSKSIFHPSSDLSRYSFDSSTVHLWVRHVRWIMRARGQYFHARLKDSCKDNLQCFRNSTWQTHTSSSLQSHPLLCSSLAIALQCRQSV